MTQEEKQLLLKDLSARLPYGRIKCQIDYGKIKPDEYCPEGYERFTDDEIICAYPETYEFGMCVDDGLCNVEQIKPYLRPMSSMTEEELKEYSKLWDLQDEFPTDADIRFKIDVFDWLNTHHFDHRGLIPKGLALEAPDGMYKTE